MDKKASDSAQVSEKPRPRQRQGAACAECRRRKLRCDGEQPNCGSCSDFGVECVQSEFTASRGPKKGHMRALQTRLAKLEGRLQEQQEQQEAAAASATMYDFGLPDLHPGDASAAQMTGNLPTPPMTTIGSDQMVSLDMSSMDMDILPMFDHTLDPIIPELVRSDLDHVYFERAHSFAPILQRRRYFSWARQPIKTDGQRCLQYAVWALAACVSAQSEHYRPLLHATACRIIGELECRNPSPDQIEIEHAQALVLLLIHDFLKGVFHQGWLGAAKCFRLLQFMRLYEIDSPQNVALRQAAPNGEDVIHTEEMRRAFWIAFSIDRFVNLKSDRPLTFQESVISVRLPVPDEQFQNGNCSARSFLSEAITSVPHQDLCSFSESIIIATICGRAMSHRQQAAVENMYSSVASQFWDRHFWLEELLTTRAQFRSFDRRNAMEDDSLLFFTKMASSCIMLYLCQDIDAKVWTTPEDKLAVVGVKKRAEEAAREMVDLAESLAHLSHFKVHPFTPLLLVVCADFLKCRQDESESDGHGAEKILRLLSDMSSVNNLACDGLKDMAVPFSRPGTPYSMRTQPGLPQRTSSVSMGMGVSL